MNINEPPPEAVVLDLSPLEVAVLRDAVVMWLADWLVRVTNDLGDEVVEPYTTMIDVGRRLGLGL